MDVAKVVAVLLCGGQALPELYGVDQVAAGRLPLVLVPTTAGTGSEVTPVAVITTGETTKAGMSLLACRVSAEEILAPLPEAPIGNTQFAGHLLEAVVKRSYMDGIQWQRTSLLERAERSAFFCCQRLADT